MKPLFYFSSLPVVCLVASLGLSGCSGFGTAVSMPDTPAKASLGSFQGSVFGGHAPVVGAHIFVLEATSAGSGAASKSLLSASFQNGNTTAEDTSTDATTGLFYTTTDSTGDFNVSGDYTCDVGQPVYLYAAGGSPGNFPAISITKATVNSSSGQSGSFSNSVTFTGANLLFTGQTVALSGFPTTGSGGTLGGLNGTIATVTSATVSTFTVTVTTTSKLTGTNVAVTATGQPQGINNPSIVNLAMLGVCGTGQNFSSIPFVFMNEISTTATMYSMAGFATSPVQISSSAADLTGLQNAAINAAQIYNIQGGPISTNNFGEGHIANVTTPGGNGTVPQTLVDSLGNILAACVDSSNSGGANGPSGLGYTVSTSSPTFTSESSECTALFNEATNTGDACSGSPTQCPSGTTAPTDIATAVLNIAHFPASNVLDIFAVQGSSEVPFAPKLAAAPNDWTLGITFTSTAINGPHEIAIDAGGNAWITNALGTEADELVKLTPTGTVATNFPITLSTAAVQVAIDPSGDAWVTTNMNKVAKFNNAGGSLGTFPSKTSGSFTKSIGVAIDGSGNVYITQNSVPSEGIYVLTNAGVASGEVITACTEGNDTFPEYLALDDSTPPNVWASGIGGLLCEFTGGGGNNFINGDGQGNAFSIDANHSAWIPLPSSSLVDEVDPTSGALNSNHPNGISNGGLSTPFSVAIDGSDNIWVGNAGNFTVSEFTNAGTAITGTTGYQDQNPNLTISGEDANLAIDGSGDVWVAYQPAGSGKITTVTEIIGAATPITTPLSVAVKDGTIGTNPNQ
jgi:streptogramin lyase